MKNIKGSRYVLAVNNLEVSKNYFQHTLGFSIVNQYPGWAFLSRESFYVMLGECKETPPAKEIGDHSYFAYIDVKDAQSLYDEFKSKEVDFVKTLRDEEWGMKEFGIQTVDGHRIMFGENIENQNT
jgi:catechol 2,3-dioxygenase-like lactoylglutathione lyase family enzyme